MLLGLREGIYGVWTHNRSPKHVLLDVIEHAQSHAVLLPGRHSKPGEYYNALPEGVKEKLRALTSEDASVPLCQKWRYG